MKWTVVFLIYFVLDTCAVAQEINNLRKTTLHVHANKWLNYETEPVICNSVFVYDSHNNLINSQFYKLSENCSEILFFTSHDSVILEYRIFNPTIFFKQKYKPIAIDSLKYRPMIFKVSDIENKVELFEGLNKSGSISRGLVSGSAQNTQFSSGLNLQLSGNLGKGMEVVASLTDNSIPIQPDGSTLQLQDFDKVFIQIKNKKYNLTLGDYDLNVRSAAFLSSFKNTRGFKYAINDKLNKNWDINSSLNFSFARGKFNRMVFNGKEGLQGPYRLFGNANEVQIVILAASEKVYVDGVLLKRGELYDYKIDYNTAEIVFTPNMLITNQSRIILEFEYANQAYSRSITYLESSIASKKTSFDIKYYREGDNRNQPLFRENSQNEIDFYSKLSSQNPVAYLPNSDSLFVDPNSILYRKVDTLGYSKVYVYNASKIDSGIRVQFVWVGNGKGDYDVDPININGKVFKWLRPVINGSDTVKQGSYIPAIQVTLPSNNELIVITGGHQISQKTKIQNELAFSSSTKNQFAENTNTGLANKFSINNLNQYNNNLSLYSTVSWEHLSNNFRIIQPLRNAEFARDWNVKNVYSNNLEDILNLNLNLKKAKNLSMLMDYSRYTVSTNYIGNKIKLNSQYIIKEHEFGGELNNLNFSDSLNSGNYFRPRIWHSFKYNNIFTKITYEEEVNKIRIKNTNTLSQNAFEFKIIDFSFSKITPVSKYSFNYLFREDKRPFEQQFYKTQIGQSVNVGYELLENKNIGLKSNFIFRDLKSYSNSVDTIGSGSVYLFQTDASFNAFKRLITCNLFYSLNTGQEPIREFSFVKVPKGQGNYIWNDYNTDGIKQLSEFEFSFFSDQGDYIKVFLQGNQFVKSFFNQYYHTINFDLARVITRGSFIKNNVRKISAVSYFSSDIKTTGNDVLQTINPFRSNIENSTLLANSTLIKNSIYFQRFSSNFGFDFNFLNGNNRNYFNYGFESKSINEKSLKLRWLFLSNLSVDFTKIYQIKNLSSELNVSRNYGFYKNENEIRLNWQQSNNFRLSVVGAYIEKTEVLKSDQLKEPNKLNGIKATIDLGYNLPKEGLLRAQFSIIDYRYNGLTNTAIAYEMLEGLNAGKNYLWSVSVFRKISDQIQLNLTYDGRKSGLVSTNHTARVQIRYIF